jgi:hypothetical protein
MQAGMNNLESGKYIMLYGGDQSYWENEISVMPFENAIRTLDKILTGTLI